MSVVSDASDESDVERLRRLVGPSETSYAQLLADRDEPSIDQVG